MKCTINDIANVISESIPNPAESGYDIFVGLEHYDSGEVKITRYGSTDSLVTAVKVFKKGDILLARRNVYLKRAGLVDFDGVTSGDSIVLRVKPDLSKLGTSSSSVQKYLPFVLNTEEFWNYAEKYSDGTMSKRLSPKTLLQYEFEIPDDVDNRNELLWSAFETKESYRTMIGSIDEMVKSQFIEMFGNQLEYQKSSHEKVCDYCDVVSGYPFNSELFNKDRQGSPLIRIRDVARGYTETYTTEVCDNRFEVKAGDLLVGMDGIFDIAPWASETALLNQRVCMVKPNNERVSAAFIKYAIHPVLKQIEGNTDATTVKHISAAQIADIRLPLINECKINEFTRVAQRADKSKFELKTAIEKIDKVMRSLMQ